MLTKLLSLLVASKGGALAAATIVAGATTVSVMTTSPEVQDAVSALSGAVTPPGMSQLVKAGKIHDDCEGGQPVVVAQRNAADKLLRDAYQDEHKRLVDLRGGKDIDHQAANEVLRVADRGLRGVLTQALNDVARETLGREGHLKPSATPTATPPATPIATATPTATPEATCPPEASETPSSPSAGVELDEALQEIVDEAIEDMKDIVDEADDDIADLPAAERGKSGEHGKPDASATTTERGRSGDHKPSSPPGKP